jgi:hypothetical protein
MVPSSPSVASSSSLGSPLSTSLPTSPPTYHPLQHEFFDAPQYSGSSDDVSSYDSQFLAAYPHNYLPPPVWAASLWDNSTTGPMIPGEQFHVQMAATTTIDPAFVHSRESSPNDVFDSPPSPLVINPHNFSTSPTLAAAETVAPLTISATRPQPYPIGRRRAQADHTAFLSTSAPSAITPLSYHRSPRLSRSYTRRAQSVASDESAGDRDATIRRLPKRSYDESRSTPDKSLNETPSSVSPFHCLSISVSLIHLSLSIAEVHAQTSEACSFRVAALLYRFHSEGSGQHHQEAQRCPGCQGGRPRVCKPQRR